MHTASKLGLGLIAAALLLADGGGGANGATGRQVSLKIPNESSPPGGVVQMKFMVTEPTPISSGRPGLAFDSSIFDGVWGIELFNPSGDVNGLAMIKGSRVDVSYITTTGPQGTDYPIMTVALHVRPDAAVGTKSVFNLDPASTWLLGLLGVASMRPAPPAIISVGGTISITNVVPGGGVLPAGTVVSVHGIGFQPKTQVQLSNVKSSSIIVVSPTEIRIVLAETTDMTGKKIQVVNPDGSQDTYFSYLRGIPLGQSNHALLAGAVPIFSSVTHSKAVFGPLGFAPNRLFTGVALQNPGLTPATVTVALYSPAHVLLGSSTVTVPSGYRWMRETSELAQGAAPVPGSYIVVSSSGPIQVFGFVGDDSAGAVSPFPAIFAQP